MVHRPKYAPRPDSTTHAITRNWLRARGCSCASNARSVKWYHGGHYCGLPLAAIDTSKIGGLVDWIVVLGWRLCAAWECKEPGKEGDLTPAEYEFSQVMRVYIIVTDDDCEKAAASMFAEMR
jgi:hypothetical protein